MCAIAAGRQGLRVVVLDHANKPGKKILISGGGRCNFTNLEIDFDRYLSRNPNFCKSALSRFTQWDFIAMVERHHIPYHEKKQGQLFCDHSSKDILAMLLAECSRAKASIFLNNKITHIEPDTDGGFHLFTHTQHWRCRSLVVATGGLSFPKMGASPFGYRLAESLGHSIVSPRAGLVPLLWQPRDKIRYSGLAGIGLITTVSSLGHSFQDDLLFTHRGLSGPAILQISSYWQPGSAVTIDFLPGKSMTSLIQSSRQGHPRMKLKTLLRQTLPNRLVPALLPRQWLDKPLAQLNTREIEFVGKQLHRWQIVPEGTEGYRKAEVTLGGVDCDELSSKTLESRLVPNLYFVGEVVDVTGQLGGYNFQWAWASGWNAGEMLGQRYIRTGGTHHLRKLKIRKKTQ